jgi:hypothetical protein
MASASDFSVRDGWPWPETTNGVPAAEETAMIYEKADGNE